MMLAYPLANPMSEPVTSGKPSAMSGQKATGLARRRFLLLRVGYDEVAPCVREEVPR